MSPDSAALINITYLEFPGEGSLFPAALLNIPLNPNDFSPISLSPA